MTLAEMLLTIKKQLDRIELGLMAAQGELRKKIELP